MLTNKIRSPGRPLPGRARLRVLASRKAKDAPGQRTTQPPGLRPVPPILVIPPRVQHGPGPGWASTTLSALAQGRRPKYAKTK
jgi:hypothetical protein